MKPSKTMLNVATLATIITAAMAISYPTCWILFRNSCMVQNSWQPPGMNHQVWVMSLPAMLISIIWLVSETRKYQKANDDYLHCNKFVPDNKEVDKKLYSC